ncbi:hypothetical protein LJR220_001161 [Bradyrhizobium sp. LjRoot220]|uniref:hypothetical protein n=1 Tax=Bradyrhizobium sp. LjRoot220 TaxID=3342284 RepID=UPI003ECC5FE1
MPGMTPVNNGQLVSFGSHFEVQVKTGPDGAELWVARVPFNETIHDQQFSLAESFGAEVTQELSLDTPEPGHLYMFRLFGAQTGSPSGHGHLIDELNIPRLKSGRRRDYLTMCGGEGMLPQLAMESGGTFVRAVIGSGSVVTRALLLVSDARLGWPGGEFPKLSGADENNFLLSSASDGTDLIHDVPVVDLRADGSPDSRRLGPGATVRFVTLVWDSDGGFDFTWTSKSGIPTVGAASVNPPEEVTTKQRHIELVVNKLVCLDDSDDLSDGEASFEITMTPSAPGSPVTRDVGWNPMETGSSRSLNERFQVTGKKADSVTIAVAGIEDDSGSFPSDGDDRAAATSTLQFLRGPGTETFKDILTLDSRVGGDGFHFLMHCSVDVSYA